MPVRFVRNSTVTDLKIYRAQVKVIKEDEPQVRKLTLIKQMEDDFETMKYHEGWFFMSDGKPARFDWDKNKTYDPTNDEVKAFKYRTTLVTRLRRRRDHLERIRILRVCRRVERK